MESMCKEATMNSESKLNKNHWKTGQVMRKERKEVGVWKVSSGRDRRRECSTPSSQEVLV